MAAVEAAAAPTPQEQLLDWYSTRHPLRVNLVGEYAGSSPFLIDGDSLLRHIFSDSRIDFSSGFQLLHAVYAVEQFLDNLARRNCVFDVVFFEHHRRVAVPAWNSTAAWKYAFARAVVVRHLAALKREGVRFVYRFKSVRDDAFLAWLQARRPLFVMAHDGADILEEGVEGQAVAKGCEAAEEWEVKAMIYRFMHMGRGYNVAQINSVIFADSKILALLLEAGLRRSDVESGADSIDTTIVEGVELAAKEPLAPLDFADASAYNARERLTIYTLIRLFKNNSEDATKFAPMASAYILHTAFLNHLSLEERHMYASTEDLDGIRKAAGVDAFLQWFYAEATRVVEDDDALQISETVSLCDFVDGRLLLKLLAQKVEVPEVVAKDFERLAAALKAAVECDCALDISSSVLASVETELPQPESRALAPILPFSNPLFDQHLQKIGIEFDVLPEDNEFDAQITKDQYRPFKPKKPFKETEKPEAPVNGGYRVERKPMLNKGGRYTMVDVLEKRQQGKVRKKDQIDMAAMQRYAASLSDSLDGSLNQKLIICDDTAGPAKKAVQGRPVKGSAKKVEKAEPAPAATGKPGKQVKGGKKEAAGKKAPVVSKADKIKAENAEKAVLKEAKSLQTSWKNLCNEIKVTKDQDLVISRLDDYQKKLARDVPKKAAADHEGRFIELEVRLYKIWTLQKQWITMCKAGKKESGYNTIAVLFDEARKALQSPALFAAAKNILQDVFAGLGIALPPAKEVVPVKRTIGFTNTWTGKVDSEDSKLGMSSEEFQLSYFGLYMDRNMDSAPDDRVPFEPDLWQRQVLDEIDADNSVFVVAPTSAGKTFISFHAMEKVLKADDSSILVYIAPTKPLVNQIAAEVISRFRKNYRHAGKTVWAIHNGDYFTNKPTECQILITVPSMLSTMLMSPLNAKNWAPRVKRIIFDEIHSIGSAEDGVVWEQLCLLTSCPIIALSATVGNADEFSEWLSATQGSLGIKLNMIQHKYRYSDLRKFVYHPPKDVGTERFPGLQRMAKYGQIDGTPGLKTIHPVAALVDPTHGIPEDLALEPSDCLKLYQAMKKAETAEFPISTGIDYKKVFGTAGRVIKKADVILWETQLKAVLKDWMLQADKSPFNKVVEQLQTKQLAAEDAIDVSTASEVIKHEKDPEDPRLAREVYQDCDIVTLTHLREKTLPLLSNLHAANSLPALMFSYSRSLCEYICINITQQLKEAEDHFRHTDPRWKAKIREWEQYVERQKKMGNKMRKPKPDEGMSKSDMVRDQADTESSALDSFNPEDPLPEFSFADFKRYGQSEWAQDLKNLEWWEMPLQLIEAFKRGIGIHHGGMKRGYRQLVETLFRKGYLRVIIATGDLAMGINMPCKTVIFAGDNTQLTALNYRQAAGRAGRRGFDLIGNVIFHGVPLDSALRLISSRLPKLRGHFPMSTSLVLRLCILLSNSKDSEHAKTTINTLLRQPRLVIGAESNPKQVLHHLRFSIEYLRRKKLLGEGGSPLNYAAMAGHLYASEKGAFALHTLLVEGYLSSLCKDFVTADIRGKEKICEEFMLVLSHLFVRRYVPRGSHGVRLLPPLPQGALAVMNEWNAETLDTYTTYVETFAKQYCADTPDATLPFSQTTVGGNGVAPVPGRTRARSNFVALSGHTDSFASIKDLSSSLRSGIFFEGSAVPYLMFGEKARLNSFLLDFYIHGDTKKLAAENHVTQGVIWYVLKNFADTLAIIRKGLIAWIRDGPGAYFEVMPGEREAEEGVDEMYDDEIEDEIEESEMAEAEGRRKAVVDVLRVLKEVIDRFNEQFRPIYA